MSTHNLKIVQHKNKFKLTSHVLRQPPIIYSGLELSEILQLVVSYNEFINVNIVSDRDNYFRIMKMFESLQCDHCTFSFTESTNS